MGSIILVLLFLGLVIALPIYAAWKANRAAQRLDDFHGLVNRLDARLKTLEKQLALSSEALQYEEPDLGEVTLEDSLGRYQRASIG
jgi:hypothetical protein